MAAAGTRGQYPCLKATRDTWNWSELSDRIAGGPAPHKNPRWDQMVQQRAPEFFDGGCTRLPEVDGYYQRNNPLEFDPSEVRTAFTR